MRDSGRLLILTFFFFISILTIFASLYSLQDNFDTRSKAEGDFYSPANCSDDPGSFDYCGDSAPFRGCVGGVGGNEWICMCRLPNKKWWSECSVMEDSEGKQRWIDQCGGDKEKAFSQWKYDIAIMETGGKCSCGGQNVCGSLVPTKGMGGGGGGNFPPGEKPPTLPPVVITTPIPSPTLVYQVSRQPIQPTGVYIPPTSAPIIIYPTSVREQPTLIPTKTLISIPEIKINFSAVTKFFSETQKSLSDFFSKVLP